ncbi:hypothetical protein FE257_002824 [Aspergillus nanangensis]|uniref:Major facilitator superfamily (MFS) profile domain-containing protein n=1 Tax=Aspergillus nanangensis TaxID=2582783 RepID=A0AAD4CDC3_ASPNN|nr:hypothetical protein FE257_002824 [Aspergillus nanangensis]
MDDGCLEFKRRQALCHADNKTVSKPAEQILLFTEHDPDVIAVITIWYTVIEHSVLRLHRALKSLALQYSGALDLNFIVPLGISIMESTIDFNGLDDPMNPLNWPLGKRVYIFTLLGVSTIVVAIGSSIFSAAIPDIMHQFDVGRTVSMLAISLYVLGFASGPLLWAPISEWKGRYAPLVVSMLGFTVFCTVTGVSSRIHTLLILRYLTGFFGAGPLTLAGAAAADLFAPAERGAAVVVFCLAVFIGALTAPLMGGFIVLNASLTWRWTAYMPGILGGCVLILLTITLPETYSPVILARHADRLRRENGGGRPSSNGVSILDLYRTHALVPLRMLALDPIVLAMCVFGSFVYGLLYLFLTAYHVVFQQVHGMDAGIGGLPYIGIVVGQLLGALAVCACQPSIRRRMKDNEGTMLPEWHLSIAIPGAAVFSIGLFWLGWSGYKSSVSWAVPAASGLFTGFGLLTMFLPSIAYLVEAYPSRAASAVAAHTFLRSAAGAIFPLVSTSMFDRLGVQWACTLLGFIALLLLPVPLACYVYEPRARLRKRRNHSRPEMVESESLSHCHR